jgi:hypothetical protein
MLKPKLSKQDLDEIKSYIKETQSKIKKLQSEMSTTGGIAAPSTPKAFKSKKDATKAELTKVTGKGTAYTEKPSTKKPKSFDVIPVNEGSYNDFKKDPSGNSVQKVNRAINEINRRMREVNKMLSHSIKLKTEANVTSSLYWNKTLKNISKIDEQLVVISNKLKKLSE